MPSRLGLYSPTDSETDSETNYISGTEIVILIYNFWSGCIALLLKLFIALVEYGENKHQFLKRISNGGKDHFPGHFFPRDHRRDESALTAENSQ